MLLVWCLPDPADDDLPNGIAVALDGDHYGLKYRRDSLGKLVLLGKANTTERLMALKRQRQQNANKIKRQGSDTPTYRTSERRLGLGGSSFT
jgi:hypothetical protein